MKKLIEFIDAHRKASLIAAVILLAIVVWFFISLSGWRSARAEQRVEKLEVEKQGFLKQGAAAHDRELILQGQVKAKDEQIANLTEQIASSDQKVVNAHNETQTARQSLNQVRRDPARFNASDDAGRIRELGADLYRLYPDSPR